MASTKYDSEIQKLHDDWCRENGYPLRASSVKPKLSNQPEQASSAKRQAPSNKRQATSHEWQAA